MPHSHSHTSRSLRAARYVSSTSYRSIQFLNAPARSWLTITSPSLSGCSNSLSFPLPADACCCPRGGGAVLRHRRIVVFADPVRQSVDARDRNQRGAVTPGKAWTRVWLRGAGGSVM